MSIYTTFGQRWVDSYVKCSIILKAILDQYMALQFDLLALSFPTRSDFKSISWPLKPRATSNNMRIQHIPIYTQTWSLYLTGRRQWVVVEGVRVKAGWMFHLVLHKIRS